MPNFKLSNDYAPDVIIVGSGPAGLSALLSAVQLGKKVLLIDQGEGIEDYYSPVGLEPAKHFVGGIGGTSRVWGGQCGTFSRKDHSEWNQILGPSIFDSWTEGIKEIAGFLEIPLKEFNSYPELDSSLKSIFANLESAEIVHSVYVKNRTIADLLPIEFNSDQISYLQQKLIKVSFDDSFNALSLMFESGGKLDIDGSKLVLALGAVATSRLIENSLESSSVPFEQLLDHPQGYIFEFSGRMPRQLRSIGYFKKGNSFYKRKFLIQVEKRECVFEIHQNPKRPKSADYSLTNLFVFFKDISCYVMDAIGIKYFGTSFTQNAIRRVWVQSDQVKRKLDQNDTHSDTSFGWSATDADIDFIACASTIFARWLQGLGLTIIQNPDTRQIRNSLGHSFHPSSTLLRLNSEDDFFVARLGRITQSSNTVIASSAIFPLTGWVNPTLNIMGFSYVATKNLLLKN